jgi:hypothetical protein
MWWLFLWAWTCASDGPALATELARLNGLEVQRGPGHCYAVIGVAGEGPAHVGRVERRGCELWLRAEWSGVAWRLNGPLAVPRLAGPGYKVWIIGDTARREHGLRVRRLGVLAPPDPALLLESRAERNHCADGHK